MATSRRAMGVYQPRNRKVAFADAMADALIEILSFSRSSRLPSSCALTAEILASTSLKSPSLASAASRSACSLEVLKSAPTWATVDFMSS